MILYSIDAFSVGFLFSEMQHEERHKRGTEVEEGEENTAFDVGAGAVAFGDSQQTSAEGSLAVLYCCVVP